MSQRRDGGTRVHLNQDGATVVKLDEHPSTIIDHEVFGLLIKMKNVFAAHLLAPVSDSRLSFYSLSFSWRQYVLHLYHRLSIWRPGHLRSSSPYITDGGLLVRLLLFTLFFWIQLCLHLVGSRLPTCPSYCSPLSQR